MNGIEPSYAAWEAAVLPLNYTREVGDFTWVVINIQFYSSLTVGRGLWRLLLSLYGKCFPSVIYAIAFHDWNAVWMLDDAYDKLSCNIPFRDNECNGHRFKENEARKK